MLTIIGSIFSLLLGAGILLVGIGLLGTLLAVRAGVEHFSDPITGVVMSAYFLGFAAGTYVCPALIRRVGHIRAFAAMAAVASAAAIGHALLVHPVVWAVLRAITGACMVGLYMVVESWLNVLAPRQRRGQIFALYVAVTLVALALGQFLILVGDVDEFMPFGIAAALLSLALVPIALTRVTQPESVEAPELGLRHLYRLSPLGTLGALVAGLVSGAFWGMGPLYAYRVGLSDLSVAGFMATTIIGGALLQWPIGHLSDHHDRRTVLTVVCLLGAVLAVPIGQAAPVPPGLCLARCLPSRRLPFPVYRFTVAPLTRNA